MLATRIVVLGPPGSGKGTSARLISKMCDLPVIATGDMLREAIAEGTERGRMAKEYMERGELVPDEVVISIIDERLGMSDSDRGFILDGFPRNMRQAEGLDDILSRKGVGLSHVLNIIIDAETIIDRLSLRRSCPRCGAIYHLKNNPPTMDDICDECGSELIQRSDDREEIIEHRLKVYEKKTRPLLERYKRSGIVRQIKGDINLKVLPKVLRLVLEDCCRLGLVADLP